MALQTQAGDDFFQKSIHTCSETADDSFLNIFTCIQVIDYIIANFSNQYSGSRVKRLHLVEVSKNFFLTFDLLTSHSQILVKVEYGGGPIFKVVVEC